MSTIRLTITPEMEEIMTLLEANFKPLTRVEILKLGLAEIYQKISNTNKDFISPSPINQPINSNLNYFYDSQTKEYVILPPKRSKTSSVRLVTPRFRRSKV